MVLNDVVEAMTPGAIAAIDKGLNYQEMMMAFRLAACKEASKRCANHNQAARLLGMHESYLRALVTGRAVKRTTYRKGGKGGTRTRKAAAVQDGAKAS